jgi:hypothetical protein
MKIQKFFENQNPLTDISAERIDEITKDLKEFLDSFNSNLSTLKKFEKELTKYKGKSSKSNDQIDDSIIQLQQINTSIQQDLISKLDTLIGNLNDYKESGRNYIYQE